MRRFLQALLLSAATCYCQAATTVVLTGTAINATNPDKPLAAQIEMTIGDAGCTLTIAPPLTGSGSCAVVAWDQDSGKIEIISTGPPRIVWNGSAKGNLVSGSYAESGKPARPNGAVRDDGEVVVTRGTNTPLAVELTVTYGDVVIPVQVTNAFAFDLTVLAQEIGN